MVGAVERLESERDMTTAARRTRRGTASDIAVGRPPAQTARILGTGLEVWEVYKVFLEVGRDPARLRRAFHWLTEEQLQAALDYAAAHEPAIMARIRADYARLPEELRPSV
jgi:uncharacterized protein (DUF433 family)